MEIYLCIIIRINKIFFDRVDMIFITNAFLTPFVCGGYQKIKAN